MRTNIKKDLGRGWAKHGTGEYMRRFSDFLLGDVVAEINEQDEGWEWSVRFEDNDSDESSDYFDSPEDAEKDFEMWFEKHKEEKQDEYDQEPHPQEDDIYIDKYNDAYHDGKLVTRSWRGSFEPLSNEVDYIEIEKYMEQHQYWPNVWDYNERGDPDQYINVKEEADRQRRELAEAGLDENGDEIEVDEEEEEDNDYDKGMNDFENESIEDRWDEMNYAERCDFAEGIGEKTLAVMGVANYNWDELSMQTQNKLRQEKNNNNKSRRNSMRKGTERLPYINNKKYRNESNNPNSSTYSKRGPYPIKREDYQGWANYETWQIALLLDNSSEIYNNLNDYIEENGPFDFTSLNSFCKQNFVQREIGDALKSKEWWQVDWQEIADHINERYTENKSIRGSIRKGEYDSEDESIGSSEITKESVFDLLDNKIYGCIAKNGAGPNDVFVDGDRMSIPFYEGYEDMWGVETEEGSGMYDHDIKLDVMVVVDAMDDGCYRIGGWYDLDDLGDDNKDQNHVEGYGKITYDYVDADDDDTLESLVQKICDAVTAEANLNYEVGVGEGRDWAKILGITGYEGTWHGGPEESKKGLRSRNRNRR